MSLRLLVCPSVTSKHARDTALGPAVAGACGHDIDWWRYHSAPGYGQQGGYAPPQQQAAYNNGPSAQQPLYDPPAQRQQSYAQPQQSQSYPMQPMNDNGVGGGAGPNDMQQFFAEVRAQRRPATPRLHCTLPNVDANSLSCCQVESIQDDIKQMHHYVNQVSDLHSRRLATTDDQQQSETASYLTELTQATSALTNSIRNRITKLNERNKRSPAGDPDFNTRKLQIGGLQNAFKRALEEYNLVEKRSRDKYRQRMERQIRIG